LTFSGRSRIRLAVMTRATAVFTFWFSYPHSGGAKDARAI
jgi:hypothetical protein